MRIEQWIGVGLLAWALAAIIVIWLWVLSESQRRGLTMLGLGLAVVGAVLVAVISWPL